MLKELIKVFAVLSLVFQSSIFAQETLSDNNKSQGASIRNSLAQSGRLALENSDQIRAKKLDIDRQIEQGRETDSAYYPSLSVGLGIGREDSNNVSTRQTDGGGSKEFERRESSVTLRQQLFDGYNTLWLGEASDARLESINLELESLAQDVVLEAYVAHVGLVTAQSLVALNMDNWQAHRRISESIEKRVSLGRDNEADVSQVKARMALAAANLEQARGDLSIAHSVYEEIVGASFPGKPYSLELLAESKLSLSEYESKVLENNLDVKISQLSTQRARHLAQASKSNRWPTFSIDAGATWNDNIDGVRGRNSDAFAMLRMDYQLYAGGKNRAQEKKRYIEVKQNSLNHEDLRRTIMLDARSLWTGLRKSNKRHFYLRDYVHAAMDTRDAYQKQFDVGRRNLIDVLDSENELAIARREMALALQESLILLGRKWALEGSLLSMLHVDSQSGPSH